MPPGPPPLDPEVKAKRRKETLQRYAAKYASSSRQIQSLSKRSYTGTESLFVQLQNHACKPCVGARLKPQQKMRLQKPEYALGLPLHDIERAFDEKQQRSHMSKTQKKHGGRPPPPRPRAAHLVAPRRRFNPKEVLTENQKRCRALRADGFEEDNGDDSDEDVPPGMCGCDRTECQLMHKNETMNRKEWKLFHLKYANELETR
ncbi:hypothetical protein B0H13DRAFT_2342316 [Mycena leptocephala]|nr:hypothetical protein B0H13DRAFT_2342316 [Mycena leptocephala]